MAINDLAVKEKGITLESLLESENYKMRFREMLGQKEAGFMSSIITAVNTTPALKKADPPSFVAAAAIAASLDLPINPSLGFAHIVPYAGKAQFQMGWRGFVQLAMRSGQYKTINATIVYEGELKDYNKLTGEVILGEKTGDKITGYCAY